MNVPQFSVAAVLQGKYITLESNCSRKLNVQNAYITLLYRNEKERKKRKQKRMKVVEWKKDIERKKMYDLDMNNYV